MSSPEPMVDPLTQPRDPFLDACTDVTLVLDPNGRVRSAQATGLTGGVESVAQILTGMPLSAIVGSHFADLVEPSRRQMVARALSRLRLGERLPPISLRLLSSHGASPPLVLSGARLPATEGDFHLALTQAPRLGALNRTTHPRDPDTGLLDRDAFVAAAATHLAAISATGAPAWLTLIDLGQLAEARTYLTPDSIGKVTLEIGAYVQALSAGGDAAGVVGHDRIALLHGAGIDGATVSQDIQGLLARSWRDGKPGRPLILSLSPPASAPGREAVGAVDTALKTVLSRLDAAIPLTRAASVETLGPGTAEEAVRPNAAPTDPRTVESGRQLRTFGRYVMRTDYTLVFQPIVDMESRQVHHVEALARFTDGTETATLIGFAEEIGMVEEFDLDVVRQILETLARSPESRLKIAANISGYSMQSGNFLAALLQLLDRHPVGADRLLFEVTETNRIDRLSEVNGSVQALRRRGHKVCLDDFGAGSAAFHYLRALEVDMVKIDGLYTDAMPASPRDRAIVRAIAGMCDELGIRAVAEKVETEEQLTLLLKAGVRSGQGYLFSHPQEKPERYWSHPETVA
ncbi:EAL domain-containing protein [Radicibacter daui]|uniref:EAL domain-containing protein n=1 Tax=Radicibacter daui TaxID=3064829 RepID=UPI0040468CAF